MRTKTALLTGSFDPVTFGHLDIFKRAAAAFGGIKIGVGVNPHKKYLFTEQERANFIRRYMRGYDVDVFTMGHRLTADVAYEMGAVIVKGIRMNAADFDYERMLHDINLAHQKGLDTFIVPCRPDLHWVSSSAAKEVCSFYGNTEEFVPLAVKEQMEVRLVNQLRVGFTGSICAGKSTIADALVTRSTPELPIHNVDLDRMAHDILFARPEPVYVDLRARLRETWGLAEWTRHSVGQLVFANPKAREMLNEEMNAPLRTRLRMELEGKTGVILVNGALLLEAGWAKALNNRFVIFDVTPEDQARRLAARGYSPDQCRARLAAQLSAQEKIRVLSEAIGQHGDGEFQRIETDRTLEETVDATYATLHRWWNRAQPPKSNL